MAVPMRNTRITVILSASQFTVTNDATDPSPNIRCTSCGRLLARTKGRILLMANTQGPGPQEVPLGLPMFEVRCGNCNATYDFIWQ